MQTASLEESPEMFREEAWLVARLLLADLANLGFNVALFLSPNDSLLRKRYSLNKESGSLRVFKASARRKSGEEYGRSRKRRRVPSR